MSDVSDGVRPQAGLALDFTAVGPDAGGVGIVAAGVAKGLQENRVTFDCVVSSLQLAEWSDREPLLRSSFRPVDIALAATSTWQVRLRKILPRNAATNWAVRVVRSLRARSTRDSLRYGVIWQPFHRVPLSHPETVVTVHDLRVFEPDLSSPMDQEIIERNVRRAAAIVCSWPHPYESLLERFPFARDKTFLVPLPALNPGPVTSRRYTPGHPLRLLFPGFVTPHKNHEVIIRALPLLQDSVAVFTGAEDGNHGKELRKLAAELNVEDRIEWKGFVSKAELEDEYATADLLVMPSRWEAASGPVYEAIVRELPFVASDIPPIRAQIDGLSLPAETFPWNSPERLASAIRATASDYERHVSSIRKVAPLIRERTWSHTAGDYHRVFDWVAGIAPRPDDLTIG